MAGKISARFIIQIAGKPQENVEKALGVVEDKLKNDDNFKLVESEISDVEIDDKSTLYSGFLDVLIKFNSAKDILGFIMDYTPNSVEIEEPDVIKVDNNDFSNILNDFSTFILAAQSQIRKLNAHVHMLNSKYGVKSDKDSKK